jgi:hypothetical protein
VIGIDVPSSTSVSVDTFAPPDVRNTPGRPAELRQPAACALVLAFPHGHAVPDPSPRHTSTSSVTIDHLATLLENVSLPWNQPHAYRAGGSFDGSSKLASAPMPSPRLMFGAPATAVQVAPSQRYTPAKGPSVFGFWMPAKSLGPVPSSCTHSDATKRGSPLPTVVQLVPSKRATFPGGLSK